MKLRRMAILLVLGGSMIAEAIPGTAQAATGRTVWIDVPFAAQTKDACGSASIAMVMQYWDQKEKLPVTADADPAHIQALLFSSKARGIYTSSMEAYLRRSGYKVFAFQGEWSDLEHHLALGRPLIVAIQPNGRLGPLHYVVVVGIDPTRNYVFVNDPAQQKMLRISRQGFESEWRATHDWTLLAVPQQGH